MILKSISCPAALYNINRKYRKLEDTFDRLYTVEVSCAPIFAIELGDYYGELLYPNTGDLVPDPNAEYVTLIEFHYHSDCMEPCKSTWAIFQPHATWRHYGDKKPSTMPRCLLAPTVFHVPGSSITAWSGSPTYRALDIYRVSKAYSDAMMDILECISDR